MIKFQKVTQRFSDGTEAFSELTFSVDDGELVLITGPSGSGKTTIMNLLLNEYQPVVGEIIFDDEPLSKIKRSRLPQHRRKIGVVFQDYKLIEELNVWENIALPLYIQREKQADIEDRVTDLLKLVGLVDKALIFPKQLSGGEAQRISIARALATGPSLIFADEPTGNLDTKTADHIINLLSKINQLGTTVIIATHDPLIIERFKTKVVDLVDLQKKVEKQTEPESLEKKTIPVKTKKETKPPKEDAKEEQTSPEEKDPRPVKLKLSLPMKPKKVKLKLPSIFGKKKKAEPEEVVDKKEETESEKESADKPVQEDEDK